MATQSALFALHSPYPVEITAETQCECTRPVFTVAELHELQRWTNTEAMVCLYHHTPVMVPECLIRFACTVVNQWSLAQK